jgi:hypothetical protein
MLSQELHAFGFQAPNGPPFSKPDGRSLDWLDLAPDELSAHRRYAAVAETCADSECRGG